MSKRAKIYVGTIILVGGIIAGLTLYSVATLATEWPLLLTLLAFTTIAHLFISQSPSHEAWGVNLVFLFAGVLLLSSFDFMLIVIIPHTVEWAAEIWIKKSNRLRNWSIQPFNMAGHLIAGIAARALYYALTTEPTNLISLSSFIAALAALLAYLFVNHALVGGVLVFARGVTLRKSGVFELGNLLGDLLQFGLGYVVAVMWTLNPLLIVPAISPLLLIYRAIQVPKLAKEANTDAKTGLWNTRHFNELFQAELERAKRFERPLAVVMADLDLLRNINNTYGHLAGDAVLTRIGEIIRQSIREYDIPARFGGEEFSIVLLEAGVEEGRSFANRIREAIEATAFVIPTSAQPIHVTMSLGVAAYPADAETVTALTYLADVAVYQAKLHGRNQVVCAADVPRSIKLENAPIETTSTAQPTNANRHPGATKSSTATPSAVLGLSDRAPLARSPLKAARRPQRMLSFFVAGTILIGLAITVLGIQLWPDLDWRAVGVFAALAIAAEILQVSVYGSNTVSVSVAIIFAAGVIVGVPGVAVTSLCVAFTHLLRSRPQLHQSMFNWATHTIAGTLPALAAYLLKLSLDVDNLLALMVMAVLGGFFYFGFDTGLITTAIGLSENQQMRAIWRTQFGWLVFHYLVLCVMGMFLAIAYHSLGVYGVIVFALPPFMMHYVQKQYVERTEKSVREFRRMNQELTLANQEVVSASRAIQNLNDELFLILAKIVDARDPFVSGHTTKVADYAVAVAKELGLPTERVESIRQAALLHDIGKIGISEEILHKPDQLSPAEYAVVKNHVTLGAELLDTCQGLRHLSPFVKHHHEWWDGNGYPDHLKGEEIPLEARILAVCDAVEAMASDRPYNRALSLDRIIAELRRCANTQFDREIVEVFVKVTGRQGQDFVVNSARQVVQQQATHLRLQSTAPFEQIAQPLKATSLANS
ncbi:MAG: diguanylate cyclase [Anaerolineae bacterium]